MGQGRQCGDVQWQEVPVAPMSRSCKDGTWHPLSVCMSVFLYGLYMGAP